jgi:DnaK suppressor protein
MISRKFLEKMKENLLAQKQNLVKRAPQTADIDVDGDETDEIQGNLIIEIENQLNTRDLLKINQINDALRRINNNTYGVCEDCNDSIPEKRLSANPYFLTCVICAEEREVEQKQRKRS